MATTPSHIIPALPLPRELPAGCALDPSEPRFDPSIHLQIEPPKTVKNLRFEDVPFPLSAREKANWPGLAYSAPFRILSDEGVKLLRSAVDKNMDMVRSNDRIKACIRGMCYKSQAIRDFSYCDEVLDLFSSLANKPLAVHGVHTNMAHTNVGKVNPKANVDQWHNDSVDYVMVLILSDITEMDGGELQVLQMPDTRGSSFERLKLEGVPKELTETAHYVGAGYCIFMQGSKILHQVTPVRAAREPRLSFVNSYMSRDAFDDDSTRYWTFSHQDPPDVHPIEFARHKAWKASGKLSYVMDEVKFGTSKDEIADLLARTAEELSDAAKLIRGETSDYMGFIPDAERAKAAAKAPRSKL